MDNFNEIIDSTVQPVLVDFHATWCAPCKALSPILEELKNEYEGRIKILQIDVDENPELASKYNIKSIPTLMTFKNGEVFQSIKGFTGKSKIEELIKFSL